MAKKEKEPEISEKEPEKLETEPEEKVEKPQKAKSTLRKFSKFQKGE